MKGLRKPFRWALLYAAALAAAATLTLLDTFVIPRVLTKIPDALPASSAQADAGTETTAPESAAVITDTTYADDRLQITLETVTVSDTAVYIADIRVSDASVLKTAFAGNAYGRNITDATSSIARNSGAVFAVNGDFYGFRNDGYVIRNGVLYRSATGNHEDLVIDAQGNFSIADESETSAQSLLDAGAQQVLSFGPVLVNNGEIAVAAGSEVELSLSSNPRTAIGQISALHYLVIVSDGRTNESEGLSLLELAQLFAERGCAVAYNLDGGGSSTMWFNGRIVNVPTDGRTFGERGVSDIVYFL